ncbi:MAG: hypothetical protein E7644_07595 [Ruminococcaceae bacterium]|nr:hypothetical protein [Oscillospiraceae bacterium]
MKEYFPQIVGNEALRRTLGPELACGRFSHAYILGGVRGSGKHTLAREIAMAASCEQRDKDGVPLPCGECRSCRKIREGLSPDVITVSREEDKATLGVEVIREMRSSVAVVPNDLEVKFYIIEDAHTMTQAAQNALLLTLEEPPPFVCFLLLAEDTDALLETVRSRAPIHRMRPIEREALSRYIQGTPAGAALMENSPEEFLELLLLSRGWIGEAERLLDPKKREPQLQRRRFAAQTVELLCTGARSAVLEALLARSGERNKESFVADILTLEEALRDLLLLSRTEEAPLIFYTNREDATDLSARFTTAKLLTLLAVLENAKESLAANANLKLTATRLASRMLAP